MLAAPIVVGTDGSETAERAVRRAAELAKALGVPLHIVHAYSSVPRSVVVAGAPVSPDLLDYVEDLRAEAEQLMTQACERVSDLGVGTEAHVRDGEPAQVLMAVAEQQGAQMIVVGNRGMSGARRLLGSVPNRVSHGARCAVLIVPTA